MAGKKPWDSRRIRLQQVLRALRLGAGLKQVDVATRLKTDQSFVSRYERGERRLDLVELQDVAEACESSLAEVVRRFERAAK